AELVARARQRDRYAEDLLVRRYFGPLFRTVGRMLGDLHETEDVVQESFTALLEELDDLQDAGALRAWLFQIAIRKVHRRFRRRRLLRRLGFGRDGDEEAGLADLASEAASPD